MAPEAQGIFHFIRFITGNSSEVKIAFIIAQKEIM